MAGHSVPSDSHVGLAAVIVGAWSMAAASCGPTARASDAGAVLAADRGGADSGQPTLADGAALATDAPWTGPDAPATPPPDGGARTQDARAPQNDATIDPLPPPAPAPGARPATPLPSQNPYGAGLTAPLLWPDIPKGKLISAVAAGATANNPADDDGPAIGAALASASPGDVVVLPLGTYHVKTRRSIVVKSGVGLRGESRAGTILDAQFSAVKDNLGSYLVEAHPGTENVIIANFTITSTGGQALRYGVWLGHDPAPAPVSRIEVRDLVVTNFEKMAISVRNGMHIAIHHNVIKDATATGGGGEGYGVMIGYPGSHDNWVAHNDLVGPALRHGVLLQYSAHHNLIESNKATGLVMDSFDLHGEDEHSNELRTNTADRCGEGGFGVGNTGGSPEHYNAGPNNWIHHNVVSDCRYGVHIYRESHRTMVEHNVFRAIRDIGIYVKNEGANECRIVGNKVEMSGAGSRFENAKQLHMEGNVIAGNSGYGMKLASSSTGYTIIGNDFRNNGGRVERATTVGRYENNVE